MSNFLSDLLLFGGFTLIVAGIYLGGAIVKQVKAYLQSKMTVDGFSLAMAMTETIVRHLEQSPAFRHLSGGDKKSWATITLSQWLEKRGFQITDDEIDQIIESTVHMVKGNRQTSWIEDELEPPG